MMFNVINYIKSKDLKLLFKIIHSSLKMREFSYLINGNFQILIKTIFKQKSQNNKTTVIRNAFTRINYIKNLS